MVRIQRNRALLPTKSLVSLAGALVATCVIFLLSYRSLTVRTESTESMRRATSIRNELNKIALALEQAQGGQRGFLLTGDPSYLRGPEVATASLPAQIATLRRLLVDAEQLRKLETLANLGQTRLEVIAEVLGIATAGNKEGALEHLRAGRGRAVMDEARSVIGELLESVQTTLDRETTEWEDSAAWSSYTTAGGAMVLLLTILVVGLFASRDYRALEAEAWVRRLQLELGSQVQSDVGLEVLGQRVLDVVVPNLDAQIAALYITEPGGLKRIAGHALPPDLKATVARGEGLVGQASVDERLLHLVEVPTGYLAIGSGTGSATPTEVVIAPLRIDGRVQAVLELGFLHAVKAAELDALRRLGEAIAGAVRASHDRSQLEELLEQTQRQAEELQSQQEELRVQNEELEQQTRALQDSQARLENQQTELEQINSQLEEQQQSLEVQRDDLQSAQRVAQRASTYKSEFLANMSHELRTPLNSSLILAKLLMDNRDGNLNDEQIKFAQTIYSAGNDLLTLINDILDLSKIEAGKLDIRPETITTARLVDDLKSTFSPIAKDKGLELAIDGGATAPQTLFSDPIRLAQILKNLMSNALKFTERGGVTLTVRGLADKVAFDIHDTGIGIAPEQHAVIFEAFRQADGTTNRKYGGTGLGLSISRDLAHLLGGELILESSLGRGSTFTLVVPEKYTGPITEATVEPRPAPRTKGAATSAPAQRGPTIDDRDRLTPKGRTILVIDDDLTFSTVVAELARQHEFQALLAQTAEEGLELARSANPSAIVLDVGLPDRSGLSVLDILKHDPKTRHIPVHMISGTDYAQTALEMGAIGYAIKPVKREELETALARLETKLTQQLRRVLVVEDDEIHRDSTCKLLSSDGVEVVGVGTAAGALEQLRSATFDSMVLDLSLPDKTGFELLEEMAGQDRAFPPVIVYTGRSLSREEEQRLRQFSRSIIIKGARSPERLLDEITLFLHQVEADLPADRQRMLKTARHREAVFEGRRILIVEDDVRNIFALSSVLEPRGAKIEIARNGREALDHPLRDKPGVDLVLMDIMMPEMDGLQAMRAIRKQPALARLPIIALTAKAMADDRENCLQAGANDYIAKPLDVDKLLSLARVWMPK